MSNRSQWVMAGIVTVLVLFVVWLVAANERADDRASRAEGRVLVLDSLRQVADSKAKSDSLVLVRVTQEYRADSTRQATERLRTRQEAVRAERATQQASDDLRATLDVQQALLLDSLDARHAAELATAHRETAQADSATVVERSLRLMTAQALASERLARQADTPLIGALREEVSALKRARTLDKLKYGGVIAAVVTIAVLTR